MQSGKQGIEYQAQILLLLLLYQVVVVVFSDPELNSE